MGCKGRSFWDCTGFIRCVEEESKVGKGMDLGDLGSNKYGHVLV